MIRTHLLKSFVPPRFCCEARFATAHIINHLPFPMLNYVSHFFMLYVHSLSYFDFRPFGCICFVHFPTHEWHTLTIQSVKCTFLGCSISQKGYICYALMLNASVFLGIWFSLNINIFFLLMLNYHLHLYLFCLAFLNPQQLWNG